MASEQLTSGIHGVNNFAKGMVDTLTRVVDATEVLLEKKKAVDVATAATVQEEKEQQELVATSATTTPTVNNPAIVEPLSNSAVQLRRAREAEANNAWSARFEAIEANKAAKSPAKALAETKESQHNYKNTNAIKESSTVQERSIINNITLSSNNELGNMMMKNLSQQIQNLVTKVNNLEHEKDSQKERIEELETCAKQNVQVHNELRKDLLQQREQIFVITEKMNNVSIVDSETERHRNENNSQNDLRHRSPGRNENNSQNDLRDGDQSFGGGGDFYNDGIGAGDLDDYDSSTNDALRKSSLSPERSLSKRTLSIYSSHGKNNTPGNPLFNISGSSHESVIGGGGDFYNDGSIGAGDLHNYGSSTNDALRKSSLSPERSSRTLSIYSSHGKNNTPGNPLFNISGSSHESANTVHSPYRRGNNGDNENGSLNLSLSPINLADTDSGDEQQQHKQHEEEKTEIDWMVYTVPMNARNRNPKWKDFFVYVFEYINAGKHWQSSTCTSLFVSFCRQYKGNLSQYKGLETKPRTANAVAAVNTSIKKFFDAKLKAEDNFFLGRAYELGIPYIKVVKENRSEKQAMLYYKRASVTNEDPATCNFALKLYKKLERKGKKYKNRKYF